MDDDEILLRQLVAQQRRRRLMVFGLVAVLGIAPFVPIAWHSYQRWQEERVFRLTPDEAQQLRRHLDDLAGQGAACEKAWLEVATREKLEALKESDAPCSANLFAPTREAADSYVESGSIDGNYFGAWGLRLRRAGEPVGASGSCSFLDWEIDGLRQRLDRGQADKDDLRRALGRRERPSHGHEVIVLVSGERRPFGVGKSFTPGELRGRAFLYSESEHRVVCAGRVEAASSPNLHVRYSYMKGNFLDEQAKSAQAATAALERDLEVQLRRAVSAQLHSVAF